MKKPLVVRHLPKKTAEVEGQASALVQLKTFILSFKNAKKRAAFIYGPPGCGKTSAVYAIASELGYEVLEINAADTRNEEGIKSSVGAASKQMSLFSKGKIILVDEVDGLHGNDDRGGVPALKEVIEKSSFPIIMTANNPWDNKFSPLRSSSIMIEFASLGFSNIYNVLKRICEKENIRYEDDALNALSTRAGGDLRSAINDMESMVVDGKVMMSSLNDLSNRDREETVIGALIKVFKTTDAKTALGAYDAVDEETDKILLWIDENLPKEYTKIDDLARAYEHISRALVFSGRIRRWQHWRFLVYVNELLTAGIASAKDAKYPHFIQYKPTMRILKIWQANQRYAKRKAIAQKIAAKTHTSAKEALQSTLPYIRPIFKKNKEMSKSMIEEFGLNEEEVEWLKSY